MPQRLGQHFLRDQSALRAAAEALEIVAGDTIIEIGAGHGELTEEVLGCRLKVLGKLVEMVVIEKDAMLVEMLDKKFGDEKNFKAVKGDVREILPSLILNLKPKTYKLVGNIPYYLTGFLLRIISGLEPLPQRTVFTIQKEVAERIAAQAPHTNQLSASVQFWAEPRILRTVPRGAFSPPPKVDSAIITLTPRIGADSTQMNADVYYAAVHALFRQPRKTILNNLADATGLAKEEVVDLLRRARIAPEARPSTLSVHNIASLARLLPRR